MPSAMMFTINFVLSRTSILDYINIFVADMSLSNSFVSTDNSYMHCTIIPDCDYLAITSYPDPLPAFQCHSIQH